MIRVVVLGQKYWGARIARALDGEGGDIAAQFVEERSYLGLLARPPRADRVVLMRAGYRPGASTPRGRAFDAYWTALRRRLRGSVACHYWLGTDVMDTVKEAREGTVRRGLRESAGELHIADAAWLVSELEEVGIRAEHVPVPQSYSMPAVPPPLPATFRVLTYLPGNRFAFYGGDVVMEAARELTDVRFDVVGQVGVAADDAPPNVVWHGWVSGMGAMYADLTVLVRIPRHDGMGATVIEGLLHGRHVIYSHDVPFVHWLRPVTARGLTDALASLRDRHRDGTLGLNLEGRSYAGSTYNEQRLTDQLAAHIRAGA